MPIKLPVYEMVINPDPNSDVEVSYVAFVDKPAIERNFLMFKEQKLQFALNEEKRIVSGPAMIADSLIYRKDDQGEYNVFFSGDTIKQIALKFFKKDYHKNLNLFHDPTLSLDGVTIFESFVSDKDRGIRPMKGFEDLPDGTWFISAKIENDVVWNKIKSGEVRGFSVEGIFSYVKQERTLNGSHSKNDHIEETGFMADLKKVATEIIELVKTAKEKFFGPPVPPPAVAPLPIAAPATLTTDYTTKDGVALSIDMLAIGGVVIMNAAPAPLGDYELQDGTKLTVGDGGVITMVTPPVAAVAAPAAQAAAPVIPPAVQTPQQQMDAIKAAIGKFATGSDADRVGNLEVISKALMEYCFGWDMRKQAEDANKAEAIEVYKTTLQNYQTQLDLATQKLKNQGETIKGIFEIVEKIASMSAGDPVGDPKNNFVSQLVAGRKERLEELATSMEKLKKLKTA